MRKYVVLAVCLLSGYAQAETCSQYEYASLSVLQILTYKDEAVIGQQLYVSWNEEAEISTWHDNSPIAGSIKKPLKDYFGVKHIDSINILNSLGKKSWNAFSHYHDPVSEAETKDIWYLKKCATK